MGCWERAWWSRGDASPGHPELSASLWVWPVSRRTGSDQWARAAHRNSSSTLNHTMQHTPDLSPQHPTSTGGDANVCRPPLRLADPPDTAGPSLATGVIFFYLSCVLCRPWPELCEPGAGSAVHQAHVAGAVGVRCGEGVQGAACRRARAAVGAPDQLNQPAVWPNGPLPRCCACRAQSLSGAAPPAGGCVGPSWPIEAFRRDLY